VGYLDGNSPGPRAKRAADRIRRVMLEEWGSGLIRSWNLQGWIDLPIVDRARQIGSLSERFVVVTLTHVDLRADGLHDMASVTAATRCADVCQNRVWRRETPCVRARSTRTSQSRIC
jgi:kynureninase